MDQELTHAGTDNRQELPGDTPEPLPARPLSTGAERDATHASPTKHFALAELELEVALRALKAREQEERARNFRSWLVLICVWVVMVVVGLVITSGMTEERARSTGLLLCGALLFVGPLALILMRPQARSRNRR